MIDLEAELNKIDSYSSSGKDNAKEAIRKAFDKLRTIEVERDALQAYAVEQAKELAVLRVQVRAASESQAFASSQQAEWILQGITGLHEQLNNLVPSNFSKPAESEKLPIHRYNPSPEQFVRDYIQVYSIDEQRDWEAKCYYEECLWETTGYESVVEEAAYEHAQTHIDEIAPNKGVE